MTYPQHAITQVLRDAYSGDAAAAERLWAMVYQKLHTMAHHQLRGQRRNHTLTPTALVHETYLKLVDGTHRSWQNREHFFSVACRAMRQIVVDHARRRTAQKRCGHNVPLEEAQVLADARSDEMVALDEALTRLSALDEQMGKVVEYRYFGGLSKQETAEALGISIHKVDIVWRLARIWLRRELRRNETP